MASSVNNNNNNTAPPEWDMILSSSQKNYYKKIVSLIKEDGVDPNHANRVGQSALHIAAVWGHVECIRVLLECGANPNVQNNITGATPLHCAIQSSKASSPKLQLETVQALVNGGADKSRGDYFGSTPADYCTDNEELLKLLQVEMPAIFLAIHNNDFDHFQSILQEDASVVASRHDSLTPLLFVVNMLVDNDKEEDETNDYTIGYVEMMRVLLENGADANATPTANRNGHFGVQEDPGEASLHRICVALKNDSSKEHLQSAALLLQHYNATVTTSTELLLHDAARRNQLDFLKFLIHDLHVNPNTRGRQGMTPLHFAARSGKTDIVEFLLKQPGIDVNAKNDLQQTALDAARVNDKKDIVALLEQYQEKNVE